MVKMKFTKNEKITIKRLYDELLDNKEGIIGGNATTHAKTITWVMDIITNGMWVRWDDDKIKN